MSFRVLPSLSFRWRILLAVFAVGVVPLVLIGVWLTGTTARSGEALLRARLRAALQQDVRGVEASWVTIRARILDLADATPVQSLLISGDRGGVLQESSSSMSTEEGSGEIEALFDQIAVEVSGVVIEDSEGSALLRLGQARSPEWNEEGGVPGTLRVRLPVHRLASGDIIGSLRATVSLSALRPASTGTALSGGVLSALDPETGATLLPTPFDPSLLEAPRFEWNGEPWVAERARSIEPPIIIVAAAPLSPFSGPFTRAALRGSLIILVVALMGITVAAILTHRMTASLERVEAAASAVAQGDLGRTVPEEGDDEVGRLARSFNRMSESLRSTLAKVAERESLSAVNEFAAALAHEVRNPLTSIKIDLQQVEESLPADSSLKGIQSQALDDLLRLDRAVQGALETARSGTILPRSAQIQVSLLNALRAARPHAQERGVRLDELATEPPSPPLDIDPDAMERVFLNLLLNAVEASPSGGRIRAGLMEEPGGWVRVQIEDEGRGMDPDELHKVFEAFYSTRPGGTGVGLSIARRIVVAHGGELRLESTPGQGTVASVRLPREGTQSRS